MSKWNKPPNNQLPPSPDQPRGHPTNKPSLSQLPLLNGDHSPALRSLGTPKARNCLHAQILPVLQMYWLKQGMDLRIIILPASRICGKLHRDKSPDISKGDLLLVNGDPVCYTQVEHLHSASHLSVRIVTKAIHN